MITVPAVLEVRDLVVSYAPHRKVVRGLSAQIAVGEVVGVLGESGCGKTTMALAILRLLPEGTTVAGSALFGGRDLLASSEEELRLIRGAGIGVIFQEPRAALNPVMQAGLQVAEVIRAHRRWPQSRCRAEAESLLARVGLDTRVFRSYPHQLSGGQLQRISIAQALACGPALLFADEPTSALDTVSQRGNLDLLKRLKSESGLGMLVITHHPALLNGWADRVLVMYAGQIIESGAREQVLAQPLHPYTAALLRCVPPAPGTNAGRHLPAIAGDPPDFAQLPAGCAFAPRCQMRTDRCHLEPGLFDASAGRLVRCFRYVQ
jgi:oligopeptide/dipeptide ABC transporter ATP-binding protein